MKQTASFVVTGRVQGVYFRLYTQNKALSLSLSGWVQNAPNGHVIGEATGEMDDLEEFRLWLYLGSPLSKVDTVDWKWIGLRPFGGFTIQ